MNNILINLVLKYVFIFLIITINIVFSSSELITEIAKKAFNLEIIAGNLTKGNQHIAESILKMLIAFYPFQRFMVIVSQNGGDIARRVDHTDWFQKNDKNVIIYTTTTSNYYLGNTNCYGNISSEFESCYPQTNKLLQYIGDICGEDGGFNSESVAVRGIVRADNIGMATSLPKFAFRDEIYTCPSSTSSKQRWRVIIALFQNYEKVLDQFIIINTDNNSTSFQQINESNFIEIPKFIVNSVSNSFEKFTFKPVYFGISVLFGILITLIFISIIAVSICFILKYRQKIYYGKK